MTEENIPPANELAVVNKIEIAINAKLVILSLIILSVFVVAVVGGTVFAIRFLPVANFHEGIDHKVYRASRAEENVNRKHLIDDALRRSRSDATAPGSSNEESLFVGMFANLSVFGPSTIDEASDSNEKKVNLSDEQLDAELVIEQNVVMVKDLTIDLSKAEAVNVPAIVHKLMPEKARIFEIFKLEHLPLTAWSIQPQPDVPRAEIIYTTTDGRYAMMGPLLELDQSGGVINRSVRLAEDHGPKVDLHSAWGTLGSTTYFKEGSPDDSAKFIMYGFMDPNCVYCFQAWSLLTPYLKAGLQIRWIPVAVIDPTTSKTKVAALFESKDPIGAIQSAYKLWPTKKSAAFEPVKMITPEVEHRVELNNKAMVSVGAFGTPAFMYKDKGGNVKKVAGFIPTDEIAKITGIILPPSPNALVGQASR